MKRIYKRLTRIPEQKSQARPEMIALHDVSIDARVTKMVQPDTHWVEVDRSEQMLYLYFNSDIIKAWQVSTGRPAVGKENPSDKGVYLVITFMRNIRWGVLRMQGRVGGFRMCPGLSGFMASWRSTAHIGITTLERRYLMAA